MFWLGEHESWLCEGISRRRWLGVGALAAAGLALLGLLRSAAVVNGALALLFLAFSTPGPAAYLLDSPAYVQRYGRAAVNDLRLTLVIAAFAVAALALSGLSLTGRRAAFWLGWAANLPTAGLVLYLAFWFHVF